MLQCVVSEMLRFPFNVGVSSLVFVHLALVFLTFCLEIKTKKFQLYRYDVSHCMNCLKKEKKKKKKRKEGRKEEEEE